MFTAKNIPILTQSYSNITNHFNDREQRAISLHLAELPAFLATQTGGDAVRLLVEEFLYFVVEKHNLLD